MKRITGKLLFLSTVLLLAISFNSDAAKHAVNYALEHAMPIGLGALALALAVKPTGQLNTGIDVTALTNSINQWGGNYFVQKMNLWKPEGDFELINNVKQPMPLPKLSPAGQPRPYREQADTTGNGVDFTDRVLTVYDSKWDFVLDPTKYRNTYLAKSGKFDPKNQLFWQYLVEILVKKYLSQINNLTIMDGVRNASGTGAVDLFDGIVEISTNDMSLTPIATGAISSANAVTKVELVAEGTPMWMREEGFDIFCSFTTFDDYKKHYRTLNNIGFDQRATKSIPLDGFNATLQPRSWVGTSDALVAVPREDRNLYIGYDGDKVEVHATKRMNLIDLRLMLPIGLQIADPDAIVINDQL